MAKNKKKMNEFLVIALVVIGAIAVFVGYNVLMGTNSPYESLTEVDFKEYQKMMEDNESFFFTVSSAGCSACKTFMPKLDETLAEKNITGYYIDIDKLSSAESLQLAESMLGSKEAAESMATPTTFYVEAGISKFAPLIGDHEKENIISFIEIYE